MDFTWFLYYPLNRTIKTTLRISMVLHAQIDTHTYSIRTAQGLIKLRERNAYYCWHL